MSFPDAPFTWDMRVAAADEPVRVEWDCTGGPPGLDRHPCRLATGVRKPFFDF